MTEDVDALLASLRASRTDPMVRMSEIGDRVAQVRARHAERVRNDPQGLPDGIVEALVAASGPDSPLACQRVRGFVDDGVLTWQQLYADPEGTAGPEGRELVRRAQRLGRPFGRSGPEEPQGRQSTGSPAPKA